jgi:hypothetical protein
MPLRMLANLDEKVEEILNFRKILADAPASLQRAEAVYDTFRRTREKILQEAPNFHEIRGVVAGLELVGPMVAAEKQLVKAEFEAGRIEKEDAKRHIELLTKVAARVLEAQELRKVEMQKLAGKVDGIYWAAAESIKHVANVLRHYAGQKNREEDGEDPMGWGTENGQRPADGGNGESGAKVTPIAAAKKRNGAKKRATRKRGTTKRAPRKADPAPEPEG